MKLHPLKLVLGGVTILVFAFIWEIAHGVRSYEDVTIVGKICGGIVGVLVVGVVLYFMAAMVYQMITGRNKW